MISKSKRLENTQRITLLINENTRLLDSLIKQVVDAANKKLLVISDNKIVYANPKSINALGYSPRDLREKTLDEIFATGQDGKQLGQHLAMSASLKKVLASNEKIKVIGKGGDEKCYTASLRRCFWKGKPSIVMALNDSDNNNDASDSFQNNSLRTYLALKASKQGIWDYNIEQGALYINPEFFAMLGYQPEEMDISINTWQKLLHPDSLKTFNKILDDLSKGNNVPSQWEFLILDNKNSYQWILALWQVVEWDANGLPQRVVGVNINIDDKKRNEIEKEDYQKTLNGFIQNSLDGLAVINEQGMVKEWNPKLEEITQIKNSEAIGKYVWDLQQNLANEQSFGIQHLTDLKQQIQSIGRTGVNPWEGKVFETKIRLKNFEHKLIQHSIFVIKTDRGHKIAANIKDVTESRLSRIKVEKSEERLKLALAAGNVGIWDIDFTTGERYFSPMTYTIFGYRPLEVEPTEELWKELIHPEDLEWVTQRVKSFLISGDSLELEFRIKRKDGSYIWILSKIRIIRDEHNKTLRVSGTISDISRQKNIESDLRQSQEKLTRNLRQNEILSEISFILNTNKEFSLKNNEVIKILGQFTRASRVYIFENNHEKKITVNTYEWCNEGIKPQIEKLQEVPLQMVLDWSGDMEFMTSHNLKADLPSDFARFMIQQNIKSFLIFPLQVSGKHFGYIGFDDCTHERVWEKTEIELLKTISYLMSFSFERELNHKHIKFNEERVRELTEMLPQIIFEVSLNGKIDFLNQTGCEFFDVTKQMVKQGLFLWDIFPLREVIKLKAMRNTVTKNTDIKPFSLDIITAKKQVRSMKIFIRPKFVGGELINFSGIALQPKKVL